MDNVVAFGAGLYCFDRGKLLEARSRPARRRLVLSQITNGVQPVRPSSKNLVIASDRQRIPSSLPTLMATGLLPRQKRPPVGNADDYEGKGTELITMQPNKFATMSAHGQEL
jgi:hypothetical protein